MACFAFSIMGVGGLLLKIWGQKNETWFLFFEAGRMVLFSPLDMGRSWGVQCVLVTLG
jgi:hypothetical protein